MGLSSTTPVLKKWGFCVKCKKNRMQWFALNNILFTFEHKKHIKCRKWDIFLFQCKNELLLLWWQQLFPNSWDGGNKRLRQKVLLKRNSWRNTLQLMKLIRTSWVACIKEHLTEAESLHLRIVEQFQNKNVSQCITETLNVPSSTLHYSIKSFISMSEHRKESVLDDCDLQALRRHRI